MKRVVIRLTLLLSALGTLVSLGAQALGRALPNTVITYNMAGRRLENNRIEVLDYARGITVSLVRYGQDFAWSPDGRVMAFAGRLQPEDDVEIFLLNINSGERTPLTNNDYYDYLPTWSPDGTQLVYLSRGGSSFSQMTFVNLRTGDRRSFAAVGTDRLVWSPDGWYLVFNSAYHSFPSVFRMGTQTGDVSLLTPGLQNSSDPSWSPDSGQIAFTASENNIMGTYIMDANGLNAHRVTPAEMAASSPQWSPDGTRILFVGGSTTTGLYILVLNTGQLSAVIETPDITSAPVWSPDSRHILYMRRDAARTSQIFMVDADGSNNRQITFGGTPKLNPAWKP
jgi:TolB protein